MTNRKRFGGLVVVWAMLLAQGMAADGIPTPGECRAFGSVDGLPLKIESYEGLAYYFLQNGPLEFRIDVTPQPDDAIDLLWGAKNDTRTALVTINGHTQSIEAGGYRGYRWIRVPLPAEHSGNGYRVKLGPGKDKVAFIAAVRLVPGIVATDASWDAPDASQHIEFQLPELENGWPVVPSFADLPELERNGRQAQRALSQSHRFVLGWLGKVDPTSGLIPENLTRGVDRWNGRNNAADNYPFMVLTAALTDRALYEGQLLEMLRTEERLTQRVDRLSDSYRFSSRDFEYAEIDMDRLIFDNSEYVKDGLMPLTEWLGPSPWSERMIGIVEDIWKYAPVATSRGNIPSTSPEVNGEMMQITARFFWMTGEHAYLERATRIADWYLLGDRHPTRDSDSLRLRDHGCELVSGLTEVYFACSYADKAKAAIYRKPLHEILDSILKHGINEDGMMFNKYNPQTGVAAEEALSDTWGYNYNGFYTVYLVDGVARYRQAVRHALSHLDAYRGYAWERQSHDGYADSIESAINLYNREPVDVARAWIDTEMRIMLAMQQEDGIIGGWHGDGNFARTAIMYALWKQQGVTVQPWREDIRLGARQVDGALQLLLAADRPWQGKLVFDAARHDTIMHMPQDYPRINQFPEWYTVTASDSYRVVQGSATAQQYSGTELNAGLDVAVVSPDQPIRLEVQQGDHHEVMKRTKNGN